MAVLSEARPYPALPGFTIFSNLLTSVDGKANDTLSSQRGMLGKLEEEKSKLTHQVERVTFYQILTI